MNFLKKLFGMKVAVASSPVPEADKKSKTTESMKPSIQPAQPAQSAKGTTFSARIEELISKVNEIDRYSELLQPGAFPGNSKWDEVIALAHKRHALISGSLTDTLTTADLPEITQLLQASDPRTRYIALGGLIAIHGKSTTRLEENTIKLVGSLLQDGDESVKLNALNALHRISQKESVDAAAIQLVAALDAMEKRERLDAIKTLSNMRTNSDLAIRALQKQSKDDSADIAEAARQALAKMGVQPDPPDERAAVQKLVWEWKGEDSKGSIYSRDEARDALRTFPNPMVVCEVFSATLLKDDWKTGTVAFRWPMDFAQTLGDIGDSRFLPELLHLYRIFQKVDKWNSCGSYFAVAMLRITGGWVYMRGQLSENEVQEFIVKALLTDTDDRISDFASQLTSKEKAFAITKIKNTVKDNAYLLCSSIHRIGIDALESLLEMYPTYPKEAATFICKTPGALDALAPRLSTQEIEAIIAYNYEYTGRAGDDIIRFMGRMKTPQCITWLKEEAKTEFFNKEYTAKHEALVRSVLESMDVRGESTPLG